MLAAGLTLAAALGFAGNATFARIGMQGVSPLPSSLISAVASFLPALLLALLFLSRLEQVTRQFVVGATMIIPRVVRLIVGSTPGAYR